MKAFGALTLTEAGGPLPVSATQRRRLALIAIAANAGCAGVPREKAALLLWPESDSESARHSLSQLLYSIRRSIGADTVLTESGNLRLDPQVITSDVGEFDRALETGDLEEAARLYTGPLLDGFNLPDSSEFDMWLETERSRRNRQTITAISSLAKATESKSRWDEAAKWWGKLAALEPLDSGVALLLMKALVAAGNRPGAIHHARLHSERVRQELNIEPDRQVVDCAAQLKFDSPRGPPVRPSEVSLEEKPPALRIRQSSHPDATTVAGGASSVELPRLFRTRSLLVTGLTIALLSIVYGATRSKVTFAPLPSPVVAVMPFTVRGDSSIAYLGEGLVDLLSSDLDGAGDLRAIDPRSLLSLWAREGTGANNLPNAGSIADRLNANLFVLGDVAESGTRVRLSASLYSNGKSNPVIASATVEGEKNRLFELVDRLAVQLLASKYKGPRERLMRTAAVTSTSLPALKYYLTGEREFRAGRYRLAVEAFQQAVAQDTMFALAHYRMSIAAEWEGLPELQQRGAQNAARFSSRLSDHDRKLVDALSARRHRDPDKAELLYREIVTEYPDDVEAWYQLGEVLFHDNASRGRSFVESRDAWQHVLALVPNERDTFLHAIRIAARTASHKELDSIIKAALPYLTPEQRLETETLHAFTMGTRRAQDSVLVQLRHENSTITWQALWRVAVYGRNIEGAKRLAQELSLRKELPIDQSRSHEALMLLLLAQGRRREAAAEGAKVPRAYPWSREVGQIYFQSLGFVHKDSIALLRLRTAFDDWNPPSGDESKLFANPQSVLGQQFKAYSAGLISLALNDPLAADRYASRLEHLPAPATAQQLTRLCAILLRAGALRQRGKITEALSLLQEWNGGAPIELAAALGVEPYYGWMQAELLHSSGRDLDALKWYETRVDLFISEVIYLAPASLRAAEIYERTGSLPKAIEKYRLFISLWKNADPELQPLVGQVRVRLANLERQSQQ